MSLPLWGQLQKSQDDSETIEEAIIRLISDHESDPEAHLGTGESLEQHKAESVINHPAGSVLPDKWTMTDFTISEDFRFLDKWSLTGEVSNDEWPRLSLYIETGVVSSSSLDLFLASPNPFLHRDVELIFQVFGQFALSTNNFNGWIGFSTFEEDQGAGFGFQVIDGLLYASVGTIENSDLSSSISVDLSLPHIYRAHYDPRVDLVRFFIDGVQVASLEIPSGTFEGETTLALGIATDGSVDGFLYLGDLFFGRSISLP